MGNFDGVGIVKEQKESILKTLSFLAKKYGIDTGKEADGHKACKVGQECATVDFKTTSLVGHRDVGYTSCPGKNLYTALTDNYQVQLATETKGYQLNGNRVYKPKTLYKKEVTPRVPNKNTLGSFVPTESTPVVS